MEDGFREEGREKEGEGYGRRGGGGGRVLGSNPSFVLACLRGEQTEHGQDQRCILISHLYNVHGGNSNLEAVLVESFLIQRVQGTFFYSRKNGFLGPCGEMSSVWGNNIEGASFVFSEAAGARGRNLIRS